MPESRELKQLHKVNRKLKQIVADLGLDRTILQKSLRIKMVSPAEGRA